MLNVLVIVTTSTLPFYLALSSPLPSVPSSKSRAPAMAVRIRAKSATAALGEDAKARLVAGYTSSSSSGSEHENAFSSLVHAFFECDADDDRDSDSSSWPLDEADDQIKFESNSRDSSLLRAAVEVANLVRGWTEDDDPFRFRLLSDVSVSSVGLAALRLRGTSYRRAVMARLRERGYNAGVCKVQWESAGNLVAGSYEYVDVVTEEEDGRRYIVELSFAAEFEVARGEKGGYKEVTAALPEVAVARPEELLQVVRVVGKAAQRSLKAQGLHVPPWRKTRYIVAKWQGPYRRTTNGAAGAPARQSAKRWDSRRPSPA